MDNPKKATQYLSCTNLPFLEALWATAKRTTGVKSLVSIGKRTVYKVPEQLHRYCHKISSTLRFRISVKRAGTHFSVLE